MNKKYDHKEIEHKWQIKWRDEGVYKTGDDSKKQKCFVLDMFPYPSGEGLHVGHPKGYIATDIYSRMKNMQGFNVLHPMGWDAFGLPAENFAIKNKIHPRIAVEKNIKVFKEQLAKIGFNYDWDREINTTDPSYYSWTQWIFLKMFEKGLAYESYEPINWCPSCQTGLANEDLEKDGTCERCGNLVEKKPMRQWVLKITDYADRMLEDLNDLKWPEYIKESQRNWIGKSEGAEIKFKIQNLKVKNIIQNEKSEDIVIFTTRPDTLFGVTYLVVAPEHQIVSKVKNQNTKLKFEVENLEEIEEYLNQVKNKTEIERTDAKKEKTGVEIKGIKAINPANGEEVPVWIADYVLGDYGTGAVMAVPAHDERDFEFAKKYNLEIKEVVAPLRPDLNNPHVEGKEIVFRRGIMAIVKNNKTGKFLGLKWKKQPWLTFIMGGIEDGENPIEAAIREIKEETGYKNIKLVRPLGNFIQAEFFAAHKDINRIGHTHPILFELIDEEQQELSEEETSMHDVVWLDEKDINKGTEFMTHAEMDVILDRINNKEHAWIESGVLFNSGEFDNLKSEEAKRKITEFVGGKFVKKYKLRDWVFSRQRYWGEPIPVIHCEKCGVVGVPEEDLPVKLPEVENYAPTGTGESPLANIESWVNTTCPKCGGVAKRETNTMPQWAGSSWYYLRFVDNKNDNVLIDPQKEKYWFGSSENNKGGGIDLYVGGDHAVRHLIYARFWHKFLYDLGVVSTSEPFARLEFLGFILAKDGRKMSKRWGNVINPDDIVETWGADTLRSYEMFMGPFENTISWNEDNLIGVRRFLEKIYRIAQEIILNTRDKKEDSKISSKLESLFHKTIKKVSDDIENFKFNTAISTMMIFINEFDKNYEYLENHRELFLDFIKLIAPFAPHISEEIWSDFGNKFSIHTESWPLFDLAKTQEDLINISIQVNGKPRGNIEVSLDIEEEELKNLVLNMSNIKKWIDDKNIKNTIFIKNRTINFVLEN